MSAELLRLDSLEPLSGDPNDLRVIAWWFVNALVPDSIIENIVHAYLRPPARIFANNLHSAALLTWLPQSAFFAGRTLQKAETGACLNVLGKPSYDASDSNKMSEMLQERNRIFLKEIPSPIPLFTAGGTHDPFWAATGPMPQFYLLMMKQQLITAWSCFEAFIGDMWEDALNYNPGLSLIALDAKEMPDDTEEERENRRKRRVAVYAQHLESEGFALNNSMGTVVRNSRKWDFAKYKETQDAYNKVFGQGASTDIQDIFKEADLAYLCELRNVLVHKSGKPTGEVIHRMSKHDLFTLNKDEAVQVNGEICVRLLESVGRAGIRLIQFLDKRLTEMGAL